MENSNVNLVAVVFAMRPGCALREMHDTRFAQ